MVTDRTSIANPDLTREVMDVDGKLIHIGYVEISLLGITNVAWQLIDLGMIRRLRATRVSSFPPNIDIISSGLLARPHPYPKLISQPTS